MLPSAVWWPNTWPTGLQSLSRQQFMPVFVNDDVLVNLQQQPEVVHNQTQQACIASCTAAEDGCRCVVVQQHQQQPTQHP